MESGARVGAASERTLADDGGILEIA